MLRAHLIRVVMFCVAMPTASIAAAETNRFEAVPNLRRPVALCMTDQWLYVANRNSGTVSVVDCTTNEVWAEITLGRRLADICLTADQQYLMVVDEAESKLIQLTNAGPASVVVRSLDVSSAPVSVTVSPNGQTCAVACLWSRRIDLFDWRPVEGDSASSQHGTWVRQTSIDLNMAPRLQQFVDEGARLVVSDAFGGRLALIDVRKQAAVAIRTINGHNIRGLATSPDGARLLVTHQMLNGRMPTDHNRVFWGDVMGNLLRSVEVNHLWDIPENRESDQAGRPMPQPDQGAAASRIPVSELPVEHWSMYPLGQPGKAAGDPGAIATGGGGWTVIAGSGTHELAVRHGDLQVFTRHAVGRHPSDVVLSSDTNTAYVANMFDDSISVLRLASREVVETIKLGPQLPLGVADIGEQLFYDATLSLDGWYSCHSCHTDGHTNGLVNDNLGDQSYGAPKLVPTLLGTRVTGPWAWDAHQSNLQEQIRRSIALTMQGDSKASANEENVQAIDAYVWTLMSPPSVAALRGNEDGVAIERGKVVFQQQKCTECHWQGALTSNATYDVSMLDENGRGDFNPPSLHGLSQRERYFHDGRATNLREVLIDSGHGERFEISDEDYKNLVAYLQSL